MDQFVWHLEKPLIYFRLMLKKTGTAKNGLGRKNKRKQLIFLKNLPIYYHLSFTIIFNVICHKQFKGQLLQLIKRTFASYDSTNGRDFESLTHMWKMDKTNLLIILR